YEVRARARRQRHNGGPIETARICIPALALIEIFDEEAFFAHDEVIADEDARDGSQKAGVTDEPAENVAAGIGHQFPGLHNDAHSAGNEAAGAETDAAGGQVGELVGRT